jgi:hypothetical protein
MARPNTAKDNSKTNKNSLPPTPQRTSSSKKNRQIQSTMHTFFGVPTPFIEQANWDFALAQTPLPRE